ncbi:pseudouridine synthase [Rhodocyclus tenuis]|uniref:pseudouridine synthase n=1 Tax=Rhodocyclus tenuis TaxID=1066 RepID=UPI001907EDCE|nr:pseudouridine synthase [Rhodocyclus tenuis]MBK1680241.1 hypothetical protein [Rhodocyclus tenuis]
MSNPPRKTLKLPAKAEGEANTARSGRRPLRAANAPRIRQPQAVVAVAAGKPADAAAATPRARPQRSSPDGTDPRRSGPPTGNADSRAGRQGGKPPPRGRDDARGGRPGPAFAGKPGTAGGGRPAEGERGADERRRDFRANDPAGKGRPRDGDKPRGTAPRAGEAIRGGGNLRRDASSAAGDDRFARDKPAPRGGRPAASGERPFPRSKPAPDARPERGQDGERRTPRDTERTTERSSAGERGKFAGRDKPRIDEKPGRSAKPAGPGKGGRESSQAPWRDAPRPAPARAPAASERPARAPRSPEHDGASPEGVRVSKLLSEQGLCSRREADDYIERGWVFVDGKRVTELGVRVPATAVVTLAPEAQAQQTQRVTILLHKPIGYVSGQPEPGCIPAVKLILPENQYMPPGAPPFRPGHLQGLAPAGRLDLDSTGLLVLTQDGRIARALIGDNSTVDKEYLVRVEGNVTEEGLALLRHGLVLDDRQLRPAIVERLNDDQLRFVLREGRKRQIRRMCELVGLTVVGLKRVRIGRIGLGALPLGQWRYLNDDESF